MRQWPVDSGTLAVNDIRIYGRQAGGWTSEDRTGANCSGHSEAKNRRLTLSNTIITTKVLVWVNGRPMHETTDYTVSHAHTSTVITFKEKLWNSQSIDVLYV